MVDMEEVMAKMEKKIRHLGLPLITATVFLLSGCGAILTGSNEPETVRAVMNSTNARGCVAHRNHTEQFLRSDTYIIGTWGTPAPDLADCIKSWQGVLQ